MRPIHEIAREIREDWQNVHYTAKPYLDAMHGLNSVHDKYAYEDGKSVIMYFLANAGTWRGETARRVKAELKKIANIR